MMAHIEEHLKGGVLSLVYQGQCVATAKRGVNGFNGGPAWLVKWHIPVSFIDALDRDYLDRMKIRRDFAPNMKAVLGKRAARKELTLMARQFI